MDSSLVPVYSFYFYFHFVVVPTQFLVVVTEFLEHPYNHLFEFYVWWISFSFSTGDSFIPFNWGLFLCLPILGESFCLFLYLGMLGFACLSLWGGLLRYKSCGTQFCSLFDLAIVCSRLALFSVCVGSLVVFGLHLVVVSLLVGSPLQQAYW